MNLRQRYLAITGRPHPVPAEPLAPLPPFGWNPEYIDLAQDAHDWAALNEAEREFPLRLLALCQAGDEGVALSLLPLMLVKDDEQRLEEELSLPAHIEGCPIRLISQTVHV